MREEIKGWRRFFESMGSRERAMPFLLIQKLLQGGISIRLKERVRGREREESLLKEEGKMKEKRGAMKRRYAGDEVKGH